MWRPTLVKFFDKHEEDKFEDGDDDGGLTAEAHSAFWHEVCQPQRGLFTDGLPVPDASSEQLEHLVGVGRMLSKSLCDDHVTGCGLATFALEYVVHGPNGRVLSSPRLALEALAECDADLATSWLRILTSGKAPGGLLLSSFDETVAEEADGAHEDVLLLHRGAQA